MKKMSIFFVMFMSIFYAAGFFILGSGIRSLNQAMSAKNWSTTSGTIQDVHFVTDNDSEGTTYRVDVKYSYEVKGARYEGSNLSFGYSASSGRAAHYEIYEKLKPAKKVEVRFDPAKPSQSTLTYGANRSHFMMLAFGTTWLLFTIGFTVIFFFFGQNDATLLNRLVVLE